MDGEKNQSKPKRFVVVASRVERGLENSLLRQRTAVFDEATTLAQVFAWLRYTNDPVEAITKGGDWWNAPLSIHEDDTAPEPHPLLGRSSANAAEVDALFEDLPTN